MQQVNTKKLLEKEEEIVREVARDDKHYLRICRSQAQISKMLVQLSGLICALWSADFLRYSTVGCRRTGGRRSQPGSFLFFTTSANLVLILQSVFESRRLACSAQTVCDDACWAGNAAETFQIVEVESFRSPSNAAEEVIFTANALCVW